MTINLFPPEIISPKFSTNTYLRQAAKDMLTLLQSKDTHPITTLQYKSDLANAYIKTSKII